jgi:hypothetical protein
MEDVIYEQHVREDNDAGVPRMDPGVPNWTTEATGAALKGGKTARYFFMLIFPLVLFERMAQATNLEGQRRYDGVTAGGNRRRPWVAMTVSHALVFVAMLVMMGVHAFSDMAHYWNTTHPALGARKAFRRLMSRTRFMRIHASLRFCTEDERPQVRLDLSPVFPCGMPTCFRLELAQDLIAYAGQLEAAQLRAAASASAPRKSARARAEDEVADPGAPSDGTASDDADDSDSTYCLSPCESDSSEGTDDPDDFIEDVVEGTYDGPVPEAPARGVRRGATPLPVVPGPHVLTHVGKGIRHRCGVCGMMAQVYCSPCEKFLCLNSDRNCYHALHFGGDVAH